MSRYLIVITTLLLLCSFVVSEYNDFIEQFENDFPELKYLNTSVNPCDDFYEFTCGNFKTVHPLPEGKPLWDGFQILQQELDEISNDILSQPKYKTDSETVKKSKDMYKACMNTVLLDALGLSSLRDVIDKFGGWPLISPEADTSFTWNKVADLTADYGIPFFFDVTVQPYSFNADENVIYISKDNLALPSQFFDNVSDDYLQLFKDATESPFTEYLTKIAKALRPNACVITDQVLQTGVEDIVSFMNAIKYGQTDVKGDVNIYQAITVDEFQQWTDSILGENFKPAINWLSFLQRIFKNTKVTITGDTKVYASTASLFLENMLTLISKQDGALLNNFLISRLMTYLAPDTNKEMRDAYDEFMKRPDDFTRSKYCVRKILDHPNVGLSTAVVQQYQKYYFNTKKIFNSMEMVNDLMTVFSKTLKESDWMDEETKNYALYKLDRMLVLFGFPNDVNTNEQIDTKFSSVEVCNNDHLKNVNNLRKFIFNDNLNDLNNVRDRTQWTQSPLIVNAFYKGVNNRILFPASLMNNPFYNGKIISVDYGRIGSFIGHEITHGYDNNGKIYGADGTIKPWWSNVTTEVFNRKANCFKEQYARYVIPELNVTINGEKTLSENIADNGGLRQAYNAYQTVKKRLNINKTSYDEESLDKLFFIGYGTMWCREATLDTLVMLNLTDPHAPNRFRVNVPLSNFEQFSRVFDCPVGSQMNPIDKCILW